MSISKTDWHRFLSPGSELPPDVAFLVLGEDLVRGEGGEGETIGAHRLLLAGVSPVFKGMFFGPVRDTAEVVEVKETTYEAFDTMVKYIYTTLRVGTHSTFTTSDVPKNFLSFWLLPTSIRSWTWPQLLLIPLGV